MPSALARKPGAAPAQFSVRAVLLDLDGTLVDSIEDLHAAANAMLAEFSRPALALETVRSYVGRGIANLVQRCFGDEPAPADALASFRRHYQHFNGQRARLYPGVVEGLQAMRALGLPLACVTNKASAFVPPLLAATGLADFFDFLVCGDTLARGKPDPLPLLHACAHFGVPPQAALMIGDSLNDVKAARAAGCPVICVPYGYSEGRSLQADDCDAIVPSLVAAAQWLAPVHS
ncbi:MAG: phosphoglycolate phosphatase [Sterolibacterium sp.]|nr:phosphoglycolate phosphatase [Sterolibacterium sp.]